jgi:UPF0716 protein FxsA
VIRNAGSTDVQQVRAAFGQRTISHTALDGHGFLNVLAGFLLLIPGFVTDVFGALLLLPPTQHAIGAALRRVLRRAERASGRPEAVDLSPDQWERVPEERIEHRPSPRTD